MYIKQPVDPFARPSSNPRHSRRNHLCVSSLFSFPFSVWRNIVSTTQVGELDIETKIIKNTSSEYILLLSDESTAEANAWSQCVFHDSHSPIAAFPRETRKLVLGGWIDSLKIVYTFHTNGGNGPSVRNCEKLRRDFVVGVKTHFVENENDMTKIHPLIWCDVRRWA